MIAISLRGCVPGAKRSNPLRIHQGSSSSYPSPSRSRQTLSQLPSTKGGWLEVAGSFTLIILVFLELLTTLPLNAHSSVPVSSVRLNTPAKLYQHPYHLRTRSRQDLTQHAAVAELSAPKLTANHTSFGKQNPRRTRIKVPAIWGIPLPLAEIRITTAGQTVGQIYLGVTS